MSAEKCGDVLTVEMIGKAAEKAASQGACDSTPIFSVRACRMLKKIHHKYPSFDPRIEMEIWRKAYAMGITEDE